MGYRLTGREKRLMNTDKDRGAVQKQKPHANTWNHQIHAGWGTSIKSDRRPDRRRVSWIWRYVRFWFECLLIIDNWPHPEIRHQQILILINNKTTDYERITHTITTSSRLRSTWYPWYFIIAMIRTAGARRIDIFEREPDMLYHAPALWGCLRLKPSSKTFLRRSFPWGCGMFFRILPLCLNPVHVDLLS